MYCVYCPICLVASPLVLSCPVCCHLGPECVTWHYCSRMLQELGPFNYARSPGFLNSVQYFLYSIPYQCTVQRGYYMLSPFICYPYSLFVCGLLPSSLGLNPILNRSVPFLYIVGGSARCLRHSEHIFSFVKTEVFSVSQNSKLEVTPLSRAEPEASKAPAVAFSLALPWASASLSPSSLAV